MEALKTCEYLKDIFVEWLNLERFFLDFAMIDKNFFKLYKILKLSNNIKNLYKYNIWKTMAVSHLECYWIWLLINQQSNNIFPNWRILTGASE